jgi:hypothetical protein
MCLKETELYAQILLTILGSILNVMGNPYGSSNELKYLHFEDK